jgi:hypothetical protein
MNSDDKRESCLMDGCVASMLDFYMLHEVELLMK